MTLITYETLDSSELRGTTVADYLISLGANFRLADGEAILFEEPDFPVAELARCLREWLAREDRGDFIFESMSYEEVGTIAIRRSSSGWVVTSVFAPSAASPTVEWTVVRTSVESFIRKVEGDLVALGVDPIFVLGI